MEAKAIAKHVRVFPARVRAALDSIRGRNVNEAFVILKYTPRDAAEVISKALKSAVANAENSHESDANRLLATETHIGYGPTLKRFRPIDHGRAFRIDKRTNNITLVTKERA